MPNVSTQHSLSRRHLLRGAGVALALPMLEAMMPAFARASSTNTTPPRRFLGICNNLGLLPDKFFPGTDSAGAGYQLSPYLEHLAEHRDDFTRTLRRFASRRGCRASRR